MSHAVCNNHFNQVPLTANILNKHVKIHVYTKPVLDSVAFLSFGTCLCVTHAKEPWRLSQQLRTQESEGADVWETLN